MYFLEEKQNSRKVFFFLLFLFKVFLFYFTFSCCFNHIMLHKAFRWSPMGQHTFSLIVCIFSSYSPNKEIWSPEWRHRHYKLTVDPQNKPCSFLTLHLCMGCSCAPSSSSWIRACLFHFLPFPPPLTTPSFLNSTYPDVSSPNPGVWITHLTRALITYDIPLKFNHFVDATPISCTVSTWSFQLGLLSFCSSITPRILFYIEQ